MLFIIDTIIVTSFNCNGIKEYFCIKVYASVGSKVCFLRGRALRALRKHLRVASTIRESTCINHDNGCVRGLQEVVVDRCKCTFSYEQRLESSRSLLSLPPLSLPLFYSFSILSNCVTTSIHRYNESYKRFFVPCETVI